MFLWLSLNKQDAANLGVNRWFLSQLPQRIKVSETILEGEQFQITLTFPLFLWKFMPKNFMSFILNKLNFTAEFHWEFTLYSFSLLGIWWLKYSSLKGWTRKMSRFNSWFHDIPFARRQQFLWQLYILLHSTISFHQFWLQLTFKIPFPFCILPIS